MSLQQPPTKPDPPPLGGLYAQLKGGRTSSIARALEEREDDNQGSRFNEVVLPIITLIGLPLGFVLWQAVLSPWSHALTVAIVDLVVALCLFTPIALIAASMVARWLDVGFGPLVPLVLRLAAFTVGTGLVADAAFVGMMMLVDFDWWALAVGYLFYMILIGGPIAISFGLGIHETALTVAIMFVPRVIALYVMWAAIPTWFE